MSQTGSHQRNLTIDCLRTIGLFLVVAAHCRIPESLYAFRQFDLVLLMLVSGMSYYLSSTHRESQPFKSFIIKRFNKLVLPVWLFLTFYFIVFYIAGERFSLETILSSFGLLSGIGYFWIFRVMFIASITNIPMSKAIGKFKLSSLIFICILVLAINDAVYYTVLPLIPNEIVREIYKIIITYTVGYGTISILGMQWINNSRKQNLLITFTFGVIYLVFGIILHFPNLQNFRHPPMLYFIAYGIMISGILYELFCIAGISNRRVTQIITWFSKNSMTVYIWHVFAINLGGYFISTEMNWIIYYLYVLVTAVLLTLAQQKIMQNFNRKEYKRIF